MTSFSRFQERNKLNFQASQTTNYRFIFNGYPSTTIFCKEQDKEVAAAVVNKQEQDIAYVYTHLDTSIDLGSVWETKDLHFLIAEEIVIIKDVEWHKYKAFLCNTEVEGYWGYFIGPEKSFIDVSLNKEAVWISKNDPVLVLSANAAEKIKIGSKLWVKNRGWVVHEYDDLSTAGVIYYSLRPSTISKEVVQAAKEQEKTSAIEQVSLQNAEYDETIEFSSGIIFVEANRGLGIATEEGYFRSSNPMIEVKNIMENKVVFSLPFGVDSTKIRIKQNGEIKEVIIQRKASDK